MTLEEVKQNEIIQSYIVLGNDHLGALGYTDHGLRHASLVSAIAKNVLERLHFPQREQELAGIAGYLHDIGNVISRFYHAQVGAVLAERILSEMGMVPEETAVLMGAIGSHDPEEDCHAVSSISAAVRSSAVGSSLSRISRSWATRSARKFCVGIVASQGPP